MEEILTRESVDKWTQDELSKLFEKHGVGFAFGEKQLKEYIEKQRSLGYEGKFTSMGVGGMYCRSETCHAFVTDYKELMAQSKAKMNKAVKMDDYIEYELANYECYYTGDYLNEQMIDAVRAYFPQAKPKDFKRVYMKTQAKHQ